MMTYSGLSDKADIAEVYWFWIRSGIPATRRCAAVEIDLAPTQPFREPHERERGERGGA
jgi:hypothetical protein